MKDNIRFPFRFFIVAFIWSWIFWIPLVLASQGIITVSPKILSSITIPVGIVAAFGPLMGALITLHKEHGKVSTVKYFRSFLDLRLGWKAYLFPFLILGGCTAIAWLVPEIYGKERLSMLLPSIWLFIPYLLMMIFLGGGQEEFGWRGYALPILERQFGLWLANIVLGITWACWHLPLWFISGTAQTYMHFGGFILLMVGYCFLFSWIRDISGNRSFSGLFVHGVANAFIPFMPTLNMQKDVPQQRFWIWVTLTFFVGVLITIFRKKNLPTLK